MTNLLITGGAGFIGTNLVRMAAAEPEHQVTVLDALTYAGNAENLSDLIDAGAIEFIHGDICDAELVTHILDVHHIDAVLHLAAESHVDRSILGPAEFLRTNIHGTATLLQAAQQTWSGRYEGKRFVHVSTDEVYGSLGPDEPAFNEANSYRPNSPYSASKAASDHLVHAWHHTYGFPAIITNCSNNYGAWQFPEKLMPLMILNALEEKPLPLYGDGMQIRDWLHVEDHCRALLCIAQVGIVGQTYCIGGQCERPNVEVVRQVCAVVDEFTGRARGQSEKLIQFVEDRPGHDRRYAIDSSKLRRELCWSPVHQLETALADVVQWYIDHRDWADRVRDGSYRDFYEQQYNSLALT